ncbi:FUSC family protein [Cellulosilyticum ruminicola]|uniref:FUSC family protein n=1 Tax=Cellulosilyticum ruminicola TaxID=425254 RepID=UPI0006D2868E|nr:aromatic acid exporter family protein [Cellulosilyticum ruminicola]
MRNTLRNIQLPTIGFRTLKTALAVFLCLLLFPKEPFFACMTSVFCLQNTVKDSYKIGFARAYATIHGAVIGFLFLLFFKLLWNYSTVPALTTLIIYILIALGIIVVIYSCNLLKRSPSIPLACIVFLGVTTIHAQTDAVYYALNRIVETFFGLIISVLVNKYINPPIDK